MGLVRLGVGCVCVLLRLGLAVYCNVDVGLRDLKSACRPMTLTTNYL